MQSNRRRHVNGAAFDGSIVPQSASLPADAGEDDSEESDIDWEEFAMQRNVAQGAAGAARSPARKRGRTSTAVDCNPSKSKKGGNVSGGNEHGCETHPIELLSNNILSTNSLITRLMYLSPYYDNDPQLFLNSGIDFIRLVESITPLAKALLFLAMASYVTFSFALIYVIQLVSNVIKSFLDRWVGEHVLCLL